MHPTPLQSQYCPLILAHLLNSLTALAMNDSSEGHNTAQHNVAEWSRHDGWHRDKTPQTTAGLVRSSELRAEASYLTWSVHKGWDDKDIPRRMIWGYGRDQSSGAGRRRVMASGSKNSCSRSRSAPFNSDTCPTMTLDEMNFDHFYKEYKNLL